MQSDETKTKAELLNELKKLRQHNSELEELNAQLRQANEISRRDSTILHALSQATTNFICVKDKQGKIIMANPAMLSFIGKSESEVVGKNDLDFLADVAQARKIRENDQRIMETRCSETIEETIDWPNRKWICLFNKSPYLDEYGEVIGVIGIGTDITERKQNVEALKKSEELYHTLFDSLSEGIILQEASGKITAWNKGAETIFNLKAEEIVGHTAAEYDWPTIHEDGTPYPAEQHPSIITLRTGQPLDNQTMGIKKPDGKIVWVRINTRPVYNNGNTKPDAVVISFIDVTASKRAEQVVITTKEFLESVYNTIPDVLVVTDGKGYITNINKAVDTLLGFCQKEMVGKRISELFPKDEKSGQIRTQMMSKLREKGFLKNLEANWIKKDGSLCSVELNITMLQDKDGNNMGGLAVARDITERKQQEEALREREEQFRALSESSPDAIMTIDSRGKILYCNKSVERIYGYTAEELVGKSITILEPEALRAAAQKSRDIFVRDGRSAYFGKTLEAVGIKKDGTVVPLEVSTSYWKMGGEIIFGGIIRDITERKQQEEAAREREARFRTIAESSNEAIITTDSGGKILYWNKAAETIYGYAAEEIVGKSIELLRPEGKRLTDRKNRERFLKTGQSSYIGKTVEGLARKKDGTEFPTETSTSYWTLGGQIIFCGIVRDITERKQMEELLREAHADLEKRVKQRTAELRRANEKLQISEEYLKKFAGMLLSVREEERKNISTTLHDELGSMALSVTSKITIAKEECNNNNKHGTFAALEQAQAAVRKAVEDLRRVAVDLRPPNLEIMGLTAAVTELLDKVKEQAKFKILFRNELGNKKIPEDMAIVMYRVIQESLTNIIKHAKAKTVKIRLYADRKNINVVIADDGIGFDLNKALYRKGKPKIGIEGMRERVDSLGGEFTITSAPKKGTQLKLTVPKK